MKGEGQQLQDEFDKIRDTIRESATDQRHAEEMHLHRGRVGSVKRPVVWNKIRRRIQGVVTADEALFHPRLNVASKMTVAPDNNGFTLDRAAYPKARTNVVFQSPLIQIQHSYQKTDDSDSVEWEDQIELQLDNLDRVLLQHHGEIISEDDAALMILAPTRDPAFQPPKHQ